MKKTTHRIWPGSVAMKAWLKTKGSFGDDGGMLQIKLRMTPMNIYGIVY